MSRRPESKFEVRCQMCDVRAGKTSMPPALNIPHSTSDIPHRRAFSLVELSLAMAIGAILLLALGGALMLSTSAADSGDDSASKSLQASAAAAQLSADLATATAIPTATPNDILLVVPDRNSDGGLERIEYTWTGKPGDPLLRSYNGSTPVAFIPALQSLALTTVSRPPAVPVESAETVLMSCDSPAGSTSTSFSVDNLNYAGTYLRPTLPAGTVSWKISRVKFYCTRGSGNGKNLTIAIRAADASLKPSSTILASGNFTTSTLSGSGSWIEYAISASNLSPAQGVCFTIDGSQGGQFAISYVSGGSALPFNTHFMSSSDSGSSYSTPSDAKDLRFILTGTYTTMVEP